MLEKYIRQRREQKDILLMTHIVLGYPDFDSSIQLAQTMVEAGVDLMELQIPFSEPIADGPVILKACQDALQTGASVADCLETTRKITTSLDIPFLIMSYYNILFKYQVERFAKVAAECGIKGMIVPDAPPEEADDYLQAMKKEQLAPIQLYSPNTPDKRMCYLNDFAQGFVYCVARKGVTGQETAFSNDLDSYLARCRKATKLPLALGFGVKDHKDIDFLKGKVDIAVVGSSALRVLNEKGTNAVGDYIVSLR
jgi:tryptophan synthase alpha chain